MFRGPRSVRFFPYTTLFRSSATFLSLESVLQMASKSMPRLKAPSKVMTSTSSWSKYGSARSEEHTSELQSRRDIVCRHLLEKKKNERNGASLLRLGISHVGR